MDCARHALPWSALSAGAWQKLLPGKGSFLHMVRLKAAQI
jgi:hypothetical protein